jgi:DNA-binding MarR family transcriptional regulator
MPPRARALSDPTDVADRLHALAIHLLRQLRREDVAAGLTAPRLSALSVVVFGGPITLGELAAAEQVRPPTMTRLVQALERDGLVVRTTDPNDARVVRIRATAEGTRLLEHGRARRIARLAEQLATLTPEQRALVDDAVATLEPLFRGAHHHAARPAPAPSSAPPSNRR